MSAHRLIHDRGRGPELIGTRITVYALFDCIEEGWPTDRIAELYSITGEQVDAAAAYIEANRQQVVAGLDKIKARHAKGNPPWVEARLAANRSSFLSRLTSKQRAKVEEFYRARTAG